MGSEDCGSQVEVMNNDGSLLSTIFNAAILALLDAGSIPLRGIFRSPGAMGPH